LAARLSAARLIGRRTASPGSRRRDYLHAGEDRLRAGARTAQPFRHLVVTERAGGTPLTASVNIVQSAFPEDDQGDISGLSRSVSNLGSSLGVAIAGSVVVSSAFSGNEGYGYALIVLGGVAVIGLIAALVLPSQAPKAA
jgi:hypothetical protein